VGWQVGDEKVVALVEEVWRDEGEVTVGGVAGVEEEDSFSCGSGGWRGEGEKLRVGVLSDEFWDILV